MILCIETSGPICSIALLQHATVLVEDKIEEANAHSKWLMPMIAKLFATHNLKQSDLQAVALSAGPGSYTGLRIGSAAAKGICMSLNIPLITVSTLEIIAYTMHLSHPGYDYYVPMLDARRMEVYTAVFNRNLQRISADIPHIIDEQTPLLWENGNAIIGGDGALKTATFLQNNAPVAHAPAVFPFASKMTHFVSEKFEKQHFTPIHEFEPSYLKPFFTTAQISS